MNIEIDISEERIENLVEEKIIEYINKKLPAMISETAKNRIENSIDNHISRARYSDKLNELMDEKLYFYIDDYVRTALHRYSGICFTKFSNKSKAIDDNNEEFQKGIVFGLLLMEEKYAKGDLEIENRLYQEAGKAIVDKYFDVSWDRQRRDKLAESIISIVKKESED